MRPPETVRVSSSAYLPKELTIKRPAEAQVDPPVKNSNKRLRFAAKLARVQHILSRQQYSRKERKATWWSPKELQNSRDQTTSLVLSVRKETHPKFTLVDEAYRTAEDQASKLSGYDLLQAFENPCKLTRPLEQWSYIGNTELGLERMISNLHYQERTTIEDRSLASVFHLHAAGKSSTSVSKVYKNLCQTSRLYARMTGHALFKAVYGSEYEAAELLRVTLAFQRTRRAKPVIVPPAGRSSMKAGAPLEHAKDNAFPRHSWHGGVTPAHIHNAQRRRLPPCQGEQVKQPQRQGVSPPPILSGSTSAFQPVRPRPRSISLPTCNSLQVQRTATPRVVSIEAPPFDHQGPIYPPPKTDAKNNAWTRLFRRPKPIPSHITF